MTQGPRKSRLTYLVLILLAVGLVSVVVNERVGAIQVYDVYPTGSMIPTLEVGDLVIVYSVPYQNIHVGQVIVFERPELTGGGCTSEVIVHRVVNITAQGLITQGDNRLTNPFPDEPPLGAVWPPVPAACLRGQVILAVPYLGKISEAFPPPLNYVLVAMIILVILAIQFFSESKDNKDPSLLKDKASLPSEILSRKESCVGQGPNPRSPFVRLMARVRRASSL